MTTIGEAKRKDSWAITGRLVHKRIFTKKKTEPHKSYTTILTLTLIDEAGQLIEFKTFRRLKAYCVYRKVHEDSSYIVTGTSEIKPPDSPEFTTSNYETLNQWWIESSDEPIQVKSLNCTTKLQKKVLNQRPCNILALFVEMFKGPALYQPLIQGYFVKLIDETGTYFLVLVWHTTRIEKSKFPLFDCNKGDLVLITSVRQSYPPPGCDLYTLKAIPPPLVNPGCVATSIKQSFKNKLRKPA